MEKIPHVDFFSVQKFPSPIFSNRSLPNLIETDVTAQVVLDWSTQIHRLTHEQTRRERSF